MDYLLPLRHRICTVFLRMFTEAYHHHRATINAARSLPPLSALLPSVTLMQSLPAVVDLSRRSPVE